MPEVGGHAAGKKFDVVIVGARCAGAALGQWLAMAGLSVAIVDAARLPSDQSTSTHLIHPPGMDELDALGIGGAVRAASPALEAFRLSYDGHEVRLPYGEGRVAHCLRREALDGLLQQAATEAGADLCAQSRVSELIRDREGAVEGVVVQRPDGHTERLRCDLVVGADGRNSTVAKLVGSKEYLGYDGPRAVYWAYWQRPGGWNPHEFHNTYEGRSARIIFPTDHDQLLIATVPPLDLAHEWRREHAAAYLADIGSYAEVSSQLRDERPLGKIRGVFRPRYFFRESAGSGWALIEDAGHHKEFIVGLGITEALRDARALASAIGEQGAGALEGWWRRRDVERIEMFYWSQELGRAQAVTPLQRLAAARLASSPKLQPRFARIIDGELSPYDFVPPLSAAKWVAAASLRGEAGALPAMAETVRGRARARRELRRRRRLERRAG
jgi:2-polyprenyl-6-methoxyphenol hydroxylase-like FAD-dependent oxidoreductase